MTTDYAANDSRLREALERVRRLHHAIALDLMPVTLRCGVCGLTETPDAEHVASYLRYGWPRCCGRAMRVESEVTP